MNKNIQTHNAKIDLVEKFLDYANCADASYARLEYIYTNAKNEKETKADNLTFKNTLKQDIEIVGLDDKLTIKQKGTNTAYACAIEARFKQDTIGKKYNNDITQVKLDFELSNRTINFTNRFQLLFHQPNTESGFSATLFGEKRKQRNTESKEISYTSEYGYTNWIKKEN
ncbi:methyltransferase [Helicobacter trogontum]|uniref:methyltransferase n=1 Tax=Helicobacter trogontum TaxID=50960 RepID=UPI0018F80A0C|nr:methyltransferase [Helicobacter trogontum]